MRAAALAWFERNGTENVELLCDCDASVENALVAALPVEPDSVAALALRGRLARLRDAASAKPAKPTV